VGGGGAATRRFGCRDVPVDVVVLRRGFGAVRAVDGGGRRGDLFSCSGAIVKTSENK
jgi:hypothetical protein